MNEVKSVTLGRTKYFLKDKDAVKSASYAGNTLSLLNGDGNTVSSVAIPQDSSSLSDKKIRLDIICTDNLVSNPESLPTTVASYKLKKATILPKSGVTPHETSYEDAWNREMVDIMTSIARTTEHTNIYELPYIADFLDIKLLYSASSSVDNVRGAYYASGIHSAAAAYDAAQNKYTLVAQALFNIVYGAKIIEATYNISVDFTYDGTTFTDGTYTIKSVSKTIYGLNTI